MAADVPVTVYKRHGKEKKASAAAIEKAAERWQKKYAGKEGKKITLADLGISKLSFD